MSLFSEPSNQGIRVSVKDLLQYQSLAKQLQFPLQNSPSSTQQGDKQTRLKGRGMTFTDLRQYEKGDDVRLIDWRVTARLGRPHTRQYNEDKSQPFYLYIDYAPSMFFASKKQLKSVLATKLAATLMWQIQLHNEPIGLVTSTLDKIDFQSPSNSLRHFYKCLSTIANACEPNHQNHAVQRASTLINGLYLLSKNIQSGSVIILISDFIDWSVSAVELCHQLNERGQLLLYHIADPIESNHRDYSKGNISLMFTDGTRTQHRLLEKTQLIKNEFLENKTIKNYFITGVSTHLTLIEQLIGRRQ